MRNLRAALETSEIVFPDLPSSELPADQLIDQACKRFEGHLAAREARRWMEIKVKSNKPIGVCFMGDPHIDNNGCNWPLLRRDIGILEKTEGLDTLMHEINHAIIWANSVSLSDEESIVSGITPGWTQVYRDNPWLLDWIKRGLR